jgi:hypothetical protein
MSMSNSNKAWLVALICVGAVTTGAILAGVLSNNTANQFGQPPVITPPPTTTSTSTPTSTPTPTHNSTPTPNPTTTAQPSVNPSSSPSPTPTPAPEATEFQNATIAYGGYVNQTINWVVNGTLVDTVTSQGISGVTVTVVDATNSTVVYGTTTTGTGGYFEYTLAIMQPPTVQLVFAGTNQYQATTSSAIELPLA